MFYRCYFLSVGELPFLRASFDRASRWLCTAPTLPRSISPLAMIRAGVIAPLVCVLSNIDTDSVPCTEAGLPTRCIGSAQARQGDGRFDARGPRFSAPTDCRPSLRFGAPAREMASESHAGLVEAAFRVGITDLLAPEECGLSPVVRARLRQRMGA